MWCLPKITKQFLERMEDLLNLYAKPYNPKEPVICFDEKNKQLIEDTRPILPTRPEKPRRCDYEYRRNGTSNIFLTIEPKAGFRTVAVTKRRTKQDFAHEIQRITGLSRYRQVKHLHIVVDNLNTHFEKSFYETFPKKKAEKIIRKVKFHYTPCHASWLNMAEIEISILGKQCLNRRMATEEILTREIHAWQEYRNRKQATIQWRFTRKDARQVFREYYRTELIE